MSVQINEEKANLPQCGRLKAASQGFTAKIKDK
jgi:hypothetical protein